MTPTSFQSWRDFFRFAMAREFVEKDSHRPFAHESNSLEKIGSGLLMPLVRPLNFCLEEIKNPLMLLALTVLAVALASLLYYPVQFMQLLFTILPFLSHVEAWMVKFGFFLITQGAIASLGLRTVGRLSNPALMQSWMADRLTAVQIGTRLER